VARSVPFFLAALDLVSQSDCIVTTSERLVRTHAGRFGLRLLAPPLPLAPYEVAQVWHPRVHDDPAHRWLRGIVARVARTAGIGES
jgi:DNA-binding transcriptional LysR family regulator